MQGKWHIEEILDVMAVGEILLEDFIGSVSVGKVRGNSLIPTCTFQTSFVGHTHTNKPNSHLAFLS